MYTLVRQGGLLLSSLLREYRNNDNVPDNHKNYLISNKENLLLWSTTRNTQIRHIGYSLTGQSEQPLRRNRNWELSFRLRIWKITIVLKIPPLLNQFGKIFQIGPTRIATETISFSANRWVADVIELKWILVYDIKSRH